MMQILYECKFNWTKAKMDLSSTCNISVANQLENLLLCMYAKHASIWARYPLICPEYCQDIAMGFNIV